jgi:hypothetical protein
MSMEQLEKLLRQAPAPKVPDDLLQNLKAGIRLPRAAAPSDENWRARPSWTRRWLPALSFAAIFLTCLTVIAVQTNLLAGLQRENGGLRAATQNLDALRAENSEYQRLTAENQELDRLRKDNTELSQLRAEVAQLQAQVSDADTLRSENQRRAANASTAAAGAAEGGDFFADQKAQAERIHCVNNMKQIGLACRLWAGDNQDIYPTNFISMTNELSTWLVLQCPSDHTHNVTNWDDVAAGKVSYILVGAGLTEDHPQAILVECPVHHNVTLADGSVQMLNEKGYSKIRVVDGRRELP